MIQPSNTYKLTIGQKGFSNQFIEKERIRKHYESSSVIIFLYLYCVLVDKSMDM